MRYGVTDALRQYLEGVPTKARPILETLTTAATDIRDQYSEWLTADSLTGLTPTVEWVQLEGSGLTTILENTTQNTGADITALTAPLSSPLNIALIEWSESTTAPEDEILGATAYLDPRRDGGLPVEVARFYAAIFQLVNITDEGGEQVWNLRQLAADIVDADENGAAGNVSFSFGLNGRGPIIGPRAPIIERGTVIDYYAKPATVLMVWAIKADGSDAGNVAWRCDANASQVTSNGHVISRRTLTVLDDEFATAPLQYTISTAQSGVPVCSITNNGTFSDATIQWTADGNDFDLGQTPGSDTDLQLTLQYATPNDSEVRGYLYDNNSAAWVRFYDGDVIGQDNSADPAVVSGDIYANNGADLSGVSRLQAYDVKVELDASTGGRHTPRLFRVGLIEVEREALDGLVEFGETAYAIDPVTSQSEISQLKLFLSRDGVRDYRSWAEELFASSALNKTEFRIWVGHPDLARQDWLHIDDYIVAGYSPSATGIAVDCVSSLQYALATIPPESGNARSPIVFDGTTLQATYNSVLNTHVGLATRYRGVGIQDNTTTVAKTIDKSIEAIDVLRELTFLDGSALISSQGRFKVQRIVDATDPTFIEAPLVAFERDEVEVTAVTAGFERRITQFGVPYGWADGEYAGERETSAPTTVLDNFGLRGTLGKQMLDDSIAQWIDTAALADRIGDRMIALFATGCIQMRIRTAVPHPHLEPGDPIALDQDVFVGYDPLNARSLRGRAGMRGRVVQCHDIMGTDFTLWLLPAVSSGKTQITVVNTLKGLGVSSSDVPSSAVTQYEGDINHNALLNYDANRHIDHTAVSISTDSGLDGGGDLTASRTISLAFDELDDRTFAGTDKLVFYSPTGSGHFTDIAAGIPLSVFQNTSLLDTISAGTGIAVAITSGTERTISIDYDASNLITDATEISPTTVASGDWILVADTSDSLNLRKAQVSNWPYKGTVTSVTAGLGLTSTGSDAITLNVGQGAGILVNANDVALDFNGLSSATAETGDSFAFYDASASAMRQSLAGSINLSVFQNTTLLNSLSAGSGIDVTGSGTSRTVAVKYSAGSSNVITSAPNTPITVTGSDAIIVADGGLTGAVEAVILDTIPVSVFLDDNTYLTPGEAVTSITAGALIDVTGTATVPIIAVDLTELGTGGTPVVTDELVFIDSGVQSKIAFNQVPITVFQNTSLINTISAGTGIAVTGSGTSRTISIDYDASNLITDATDAVSVASGDWILLADADATPNNGLRKAQVSTWPYKGTVTSVTAGLGLGSTGSADAPTLNVGEGAGILVDANDVSLDFSAGGLSSATAASGDFFAFYDVSASGMRNSSAGTIPLSIFSDDLGYKNVQGGAGITVTSGPTYNTISVNGASGGSGFFQTAWDQATTPISTDAMVFGDGGLTGTASTVLFSNVPVGIFQNDGTYALNSALTSHVNNTSNPHSVTKSQVGLGNVENTALSTWAGSTNITTLGTISTGTIPAANVGAGQFGGAFTIQGAFAPSANNTYALGASGAAWAKVWTYDLDVANNTVFGGNLTVGNTSGDLFIPNGQVLADGGGTVSAPSYSFDNDLNTGIYPAGADTLGFATGGVGRVTIASNGNLAVDTNTLFVNAVNNRVGIGTSSPIYTLEVEGQAGIELYNATGGGNVLNFRPSLGDANKYNLSISSYDHSGGGVGPADGLSINGFDGVSIATGSGTTRQERMRITSTGNVGIGTASPQNTLHVAGPTTISHSSNPLLYFRDGSNVIEGGIGFSSVTDGLLRFAVGASGLTTDTKMVVKSDGRVGIGTTSPSTILDVNGDTPVLTLRDSRTGGTWSAGTALGKLDFYTSDATGIGPHSIASIGVEAGGQNTASPDGELVFSTGAYNTAASERMRIDSSGRVGIGTASPSSYNGAGDNLVLYGSSPGMTFASNAGVGAAGSYASIIFADGTTGTDAYTGYIRYRFDTEAFAFYGNGGVHKMTISGSGDVGIGTAIPISKLHVIGDIRADGDIYLMGGAGTPEVRLYQYGGNWAIQNSAGNLRFYDLNAGTRVTVDGSGNVGIGTTIPSYKLHVVGDVVATV